MCKTDTDLPGAGGINGPLTNSVNGSFIHTRARVILKALVVLMRELGGVKPPSF